MDGDEIIKFVIPSSESTIFASNFPPGTSVENIANLFSNHGLVYDVLEFLPSDSEDKEGTSAQNGAKIPQKSSNKSAYCIIKYYSIFSAKEALKHLHGYKYNGTCFMLVFIKVGISINLKNFLFQLIKVLH